MLRHFTNSIYPVMRFGAFFKTLPRRVPVRWPYGLFGAGLVSTNYSASLAAFETYELYTFDSDRVAAQLATQPGVLDLRQYILTHDAVEEMKRQLVDNTSVLRILWPDSWPDKEVCAELLQRNHDLFIDRPSDYCHVYFSDLAYRDDAGVEALPEGWVLLDKTEDDKANGYFGAAYLHESSRHIIIAHRGTDPAGAEAFFKDLLTDIEGVLGRTVTSQDASALKFAEDIRLSYPSRAGYRYSFAGHSLGGYLAQYTTYHFVAQHERAFAVVIDSPGARELLESVQPRVDQDKRVNLSALDITVYLAPPNLINTCNNHLGTVYRVYPKLSYDGYFSSLAHRYLYTLFIHGSQGIVEVFDPVTGLPYHNHYKRVVSWPKATHITIDSVRHRHASWRLLEALKNKLLSRSDSSEYKFFHHFATASNDFEPNVEDLTFEEAHFLKSKYHYHVLPVQPSHLPLSQFPAELKDFLRRYHTYSETAREALRRLIDQQSMVASEATTLLQCYRIAGSELELDEETAHTPRQFRLAMVRLLKAHPDILAFRANIVHDLQEHGISFDLSSSYQPLLKYFRTHVETQQAQSRELINRLVQLGTHARLYLYADPDAADILQDQVLIEQLRQQRDFHQSLLSKIGHDIATLADVDHTVAVKEQLISLQATLQEETDRLDLAYYMHIALLVYKQRQYKKSDAYLERSLAIIQSHTTIVDSEQRTALTIGIFNLKAKISRSQGDYHSVLACYEAALALDDTDPIILSSKGAALGDLGFYQHEAAYYQQAIVCLREAHRYAARQPIVLINLGRGLQLLASASLQETASASEAYSAEELLAMADDYLTDAIRISKHPLATAFLFRGIVRMEQEFFQAALADFEQCLKIQADHPTALRRKALALQAMGQHEAAVDTFVLAVRSLRAKPWLPEQKFWLTETLTEKAMAESAAEQGAHVDAPRRP